MKFKEKLKGRTVKIVCFGDSVTGGYFESDADMHAVRDTEAVYHSRLKKKLNMLFPALDVEVINSGVGGDTAAHALRRIGDDVLAHEPDLVTVSFGLNDVNGEIGEFTNALDEIFGVLNGKGAECIYMSPNMLNTRISEKLRRGALYDYALKTMDYQQSGRMDGFMKAAAGSARKNGVAVCDCYGRWKRLYGLGADITGLLANHINHPIREMHELFCNLLLETVLFE